MAKSYEDIINQGFNDGLAALDEAYDVGRRERQRTSKVINEELDDPIEYHDWFIYD